jgi:DNA-binding MarR family transcriptional regulator
MAKDMQPRHSNPPWNLLSNHGRVLLCVLEDCEARVRDIAARLEITERSVLRIVAELEAAGYLSHDRVGNRNRYEVAHTMSSGSVDLDIATLVSMTSTERRN